MDDEKRSRYLKCCQRDREHPERIYRQYYNDDNISPGVKLLISMESNMIRKCIKLLQVTIVKLDTI